MYFRKMWISDQKILEVANVNEISQEMLSKSEEFRIKMFSYVIVRKRGIQNFLTALTTALRMVTTGKNQFHEAWCKL